MSEAPPKKRVLVLHGRIQNSRVFEAKLAPFCQECEKRGIELVFLDGPSPISADFIITTLKEDPAFARDMKMNVDDPKLKETLENVSNLRGWWDYDKDRTTTLGHGESLELVRETLEKQKFDGVFGYSQGGALAAIIAAVLERPSVYPSFIRDGKPIHPPLEFCVSVCGFRLPGPDGTHILTPSFKTPTLHVLGEKDTIVPEQRSQSLVNLSENCQVVRHNGGHIVPMSAPWARFYCDFIENVSLTMPGPVGEAVEIGGR